MKELIYLFLRYIIVVLLGLGNLFIIYSIFTPLTISLSVFSLSLVSPVLTLGNQILFQGRIIELIPACIAGAAYYLLIILVLSTPKIDIRKRILFLLCSLLSLLLLNVFRIFFLSLLAGSIYFNSVHIIFWYATSTIFIIAIWILFVKLFDIREIPVYSDIKYLGRKINPKRYK
jgi:exosortase/archaeosortase family protein